MWDDGIRTNGVSNADVEGCRDILEICADLLQTSILITGVFAGRED